MHDIKDVVKTDVLTGENPDEKKEAADNIDLSTTNNGGMFNTQKTEATWVNNIFLGDQDFEIWQENEQKSFKIF